MVLFLYKTHCFLNAGSQDLWTVVLISLVIYAPAFFVWFFQLGHVCALIINSSDQDWNFCRVDIIVSHSVALEDFGMLNLE